MSRQIYIILVWAAVSGALFLFQAASLPLIDPEESRCALIVREMLQTGDWLVPRLRVYGPSGGNWIVTNVVPVEGSRAGNPAAREASSAR